MGAPRSSSRSAARQSTSDRCRMPEWSSIQNRWPARRFLPLVSVHPSPMARCQWGRPFLLFHSETLDQSQGAHIGTGNPRDWLTERSGTSVTCFVPRGRGTDLGAQSSLCTTCLMLLLALGTHPVVQKRGGHPSSRYWIVGVTVA